MCCILLNTTSIPLGNSFPSIPLLSYVIPMIFACCCWFHILTFWFTYPWVSHSYSISSHINTTFVQRSARSIKWEAFWSAVPRCRQSSTSLGSGVLTLDPRVTGIVWDNRITQAFPNKSWPCLPTALPTTMVLIGLWTERTWQSSRCCSTSSQVGSQLD